RYGTLECCHGSGVIAALGVLLWCCPGCLDVLSLLDPSLGVPMDLLPFFMEFCLEFLMEFPMAFCIVIYHSNLLSNGIFLGAIELAVKWLCTVGKSNAVMGRRYVRQNCSGFELQSWGSNVVQI
ncbi:hypothetical protein U1Q18_002400, partial [Sarracenia purpurea var. burkii]